MVFDLWKNGIVIPSPQSLMKYWQSLEIDTFKGFLVMWNDKVVCNESFKTEQAEFRDSD